MEAVTFYIYVIFTINIIIMGLGINIVAHANLSTSALTLIPLVLNEFVPLSFGELTMIFNIILVISPVIFWESTFPCCNIFK